MKKAPLLFCLAGLAPGLSAGFDEAAELERAREATVEFAGALKSELQAAMQAGGALQAIEVCSTEAPVVREEVSLAKNVNLSRVSLQNRNPVNAPNQWQEAVLNGFEARKQEGEEAGSLSWHEIAQTDKGPELRFMQAIPTGALCLQCHGTDIAPAVAEKLAELYPADKATGFSLGDLRGAFVVTRLLEPD